VYGRRGAHQRHVEEPIASTELPVCVRHRIRAREHLRIGLREYSAASRIVSFGRIQRNYFCLRLNWHRKDIHHGRFQVLKHRSLERNHTQKCWRDLWLYLKWRLWQYQIHGQGELSLDL